MQGQQGFSTNASEYNANDFQIRQQLMRINTAEPVRVQAVDTAARTVDVLPLVNIVGGGGDAISQSEIFELPYLRNPGREKPPSSLIRNQATWGWQSMPCATWRQ